MSMSGASGAGAYPVHPFVDPRGLDVPKPALGANAGTAFVRPSTAGTGNAFVSPNAVPPPRDLGRLVDKKL